MKPGGQRIKGRAFEQRIAKLIRERFPGVTCHRSSQADRAYDADIVCEGHPVLARLWLELQDARKPTPRLKLEQAERDIGVSCKAYTTVPQRLPVVVWHKLGEKHVSATMRLHTLVGLLNFGAAYTPGRRHHDRLVTLELGDFLGLVAS